MCVFFFFEQNTAYEVLIIDWSSDVCSSDLDAEQQILLAQRRGALDPQFFGHFDQFGGSLLLQVFEMHGESPVRACDESASVDGKATMRERRAGNGGSTAHRIFGELRDRKSVV